MADLASLTVKMPRFRVKVMTVAIRVICTLRSQRLADRTVPALMAWAQRGLVVRVNEVK